MTDVLDRTPPRMYITHLRSGLTLSAQFNPASVEEQIKVAYKRLEVLGLSFRPLQYLGTDNPTITMQLTFDGRSTRTVTGGEINSAAVFKAAGIPFGAKRGIKTELPRRFLTACCYPSEGAQDVDGGDPSRLLFVWPRTYSIACKITGLKNEMARFDLKGQQTLLKQDVDLEVSFIKRPTFESIFQKGLYVDNKSAEG